MNPYEARQEARRERLEARAERLAREGRARVDRAHKMASIIPFGQPILIGHHSERGDRNYRGRIRSNFEKGFGQLQEAGEIAARAANVGSGGISSDDPDAPDKLREKLDKLEAKQRMMVAVNRVVKAFWKAGARNPDSGEVWDRYLARLKEAGHELSPVAAEALLNPDCCGRVGFADYQLSNNGAQVRSVKARIAHLEREAKRPEAAPVEIGGVRIVENVELNRLQMFFPGKPDAAVRSQLKSYGFRWAPSEGAWQRHLSNAARWAAGEIVKSVASEAA